MYPGSGGGEGKLLYAVPPQSTNQSYSSSTPIFSPPHVASQARHVGHKKARTHKAHVHKIHKVKIHYPSRYHEAYHHPTFMEEQPF